MGMSRPLSLWDRSVGGLTGGRVDVGLAGTVVLGLPVSRVGTESEHASEEERVLDGGTRGQADREAVLGGLDDGSGLLGHSSFFLRWIPIRARVFSATNHSPVHTPVQTSN